MRPMLKMCHPHIVKLVCAEGKFYFPAFGGRTLRRHFKRKTDALEYWHKVSRRLRGF